MGQDSSLKVNRKCVDSLHIGLSSDTDVGDLRLPISVGVEFTGLMRDTLERGKEMYLQNHQKDKSNKD